MRRVLICGTGTEDYFCGSYNFENKVIEQYQEFTTAYAGVPHIVRPDGRYQSQTRFSMYRWHITDPIRFEDDITVTIQALGWRPHDRYLTLQDDIASTVFWYQTLPTVEFPSLPDADYLEMIDDLKDKLVALDMRYNGGSVSPRKGIKDENI